MSAASLAYNAGEMKRFEVLAGLPGDGPASEYFGWTVSGRYREGFVVRLFPSSGEPWVGNFERTIVGLDDVFDVSGGGSILVIAGGQGYEIDPDRRLCVRTFGGSIDAALYVREIQAVVFSNGIELEAVGAKGPLWKTPRVSWDGIRGLRTAESTLTAEAYDPMTDKWAPFAVDLRDGSVVSGLAWSPD